MIFSNETRGNSPNKAELITRLKSIESCINNNERLQEVSIELCKRAFSLLADCALVTEDNVRFLNDAKACAEYDTDLKFPYNRGEGVLRKVERDDDIYDNKGIQRFYRGDKMCVVCGGIKYLIANNWFGDPPNGKGLSSNRRAFYNWVALKTKAALNVK